MDERAKPNDVELQEAVLGELRWDSRVSATDVGVEVHRGVVTLTGIVETLPERIAAQSAAHRVAGVLDVANEIEVRPPELHRRTDTDIAAAVRNALSWNTRIPANAIHTTVTSGVVTLDGEVSFLSERDDAETAVQHVAGVRAVTNRIRVQPPLLTPADVRRAVTDALERQALRESRHLDIELDSGVVTVSGAVRSWAERRAIVGTLSGMRGVVAVKDKLMIDRTT